MIIESLFCNSNDVFVGIAEIQNTRNLTKDELIALAAHPSDGILATQFLKASLIAGGLHLISAAQNALNSHNGNYALARSLDVEILVYASLQRQIGRAIDIIGVNDEQTSVGLVILGIDRDLVQKRLDRIISSVGHGIDPPFAQSFEEIRETARQFDVSTSEIDLLETSDDIESKRSALTKCIVSRVSMVSLDS